MEHRSVGTSGLVVSAVGLGCGAFGRRSDEGAKKLVSADRATETIYAAVESGVTLFDTSDSYGDCEQLLGKCLRGHRDDVVIATKFGNHIRGTSRVPLDARARAATSGLPSSGRYGAWTPITSTSISCTLRIR